MAQRLARWKVDEVIEWLLEGGSGGGGVSLGGEPVAGGWVCYDDKGLRTAEQRRDFWETELGLVEPEPGRELFGVVRRSKSGRWDPNAKAEHGMAHRRLYLVGDGGALDQPTGTTIPTMRIQQNLLESRDAVALLGNMVVLYSAAMQEHSAQAQQQNRELNELLKELLGQNKALLESRTSREELQAVLEAIESAGSSGMDMTKVWAAIEKRLPAFKRTIGAVLLDEHMPDGVKTAAAVTNVLLSGGGAGA